jgi:hypothetical protein
VRKRSNLDFACENFRAESPSPCFQYIYSISYDSQKYPAKNLLEKKEAKSWKCKTAGELTAQVILQLEKPVIVTGIDIGNECSAFIQVMVGRKRGEIPPKDDDYQVIYQYRHSICFSLRSVIIFFRLFCSPHRLWYPQNAAA